MKKLDQDGNGQDKFHFRWLKIEGNDDARWWHRLFIPSKIKLIKVDFLEFVTFMIDGQAVTSNQKEIHSSSTVNESSDDVCTAAFSIFDADKDGLISPSDLR